MSTSTATSTVEQDVDWTLGNLVTLTWGTANLAHMTRVLIAELGMTPAEARDAVERWEERQGDLAVPF